MKPIKYSITVPGSKSLLNRALLCAALATGTSKIMNPVYCDDTWYMIKTLQKLGIKIETKPSYLIVHGSRRKVEAIHELPHRKIYIGNAGTVKRFLTPFVAVGSLVGSKRMSQRPNTALEQAVNELRIKNKVKITGKVSSQFISALLMYAPTLGKSVSITVTGKLVSAPYVQMTINVMKHFGVKIITRNSLFIIHPQHYKAATYIVEGDASSATYWWALAALTDSKITVTNIPQNTLQPDAQFPTKLARILKTGRVNMQDTPDSVPALAMVLAVTPGKHTITGIHHLRYKESDRLQLLQHNLKQLGIRSQITADTMTIIGGKVKKRLVKTQHDHRLAMSFALLDVPLDDRSCVKKSYPDFWKDFRKIKQHRKHQSIVLIGMRGVGKTTYGKQLAKKLNMKFIDTDAGLQFHNWPQFRRDEHAIVKKIYNKTNTVIATGGGTLMYPRNVKLLKQHYIILITTPLSIIKKRLLKQTHRPALTKGYTVTSELNTVWRQRKAKYYALADSVYDCR